MKVAFLSNHALSRDGWGRYTVEVVAHLRELGVEPVLLTANPQLDPRLKGVTHYPILEEYFNTQRGTFARMLLKVGEIRQTITGCDLVHVTNELYGPSAYFAKPKGMPYVQNAHGTWAVQPFKSRLKRFFFRQAFGHADAILALSHYTWQRMAQHVTMQRVEVMPGGVHPAPFMTPVQTAFPAWAEDASIVFAAGAIKRRKGHHITLEAVAQAREQIPNLHYVIAGQAPGSGAYKAELENQAHALRIGDRVHFLGHLPAYSDLIAWFQRADIFVMPSVNVDGKFEGLGLVYLEAGAAGTPAIGTQDCGAEEAIRDGITGFTVPQHDVDALARSIVTLLRDDTLRERMAEAARQHAQSLSWEQLASRIYQVYQSLLKE